MLFDLGIWTGVCGEMAGDVLLTPLLLGLGVDELSATSVIVPRVKKAVQSLDASQCEALVRTALTMEDSAAIQKMSLDMARDRYAEIAD